MQPVSEYRHVGRDTNNATGATTAPAPCDVGVKGHATEWRRVDNATPLIDS